jgi:3-hydroxybutyryl-CoA dehydrogenase
MRPRRAWHAVTVSQPASQPVNSARPIAVTTGRDCNVAAMDIERVAVVGLGTMGAGIAEVLARSGLQVVGIEVDEAALSRGVANLDASLVKAVSRGKLTETEQAEIRGRIQPVTGFGEAAAVDLAIEVVPERLEIKHQMFAELDRVCSPSAILATNTSSLSVTAIAAGTTHPERVVGMHFFNPATVMRLVEVVSTVLTGPGTTDTVTALARRLGKTPVQVTDRAGFIANALLLPYLNHAARLLETGYASRADIDTAATQGAGLPMGPLALLDLIGIDTCVSILQVLQAEFGGGRYVPSPVLRRLTDAGRTGRKSGQGFYDYGKDTAFGWNDTGVDSGAGVPGLVTVIGSSDFDQIGTDLASAAINITRNPAHDSELILLEATLAGPVLPAALAAGRPERAVGLHRAGVADGDLTELISTGLTSTEATSAAAALAAKLGMRIVRSPDRPGFLVAALLFPHLADAVRMVQDGYASAADVDTAMTLGCGYPRGPFALLDGIGPAEVAEVLETMQAGYGDPAYAVPPLLAEHAAAGLPFLAATAEPR